MSEFLAAAAAAVGGPEDLVERSAAARAEAQGVTTEEVLRAWAGGGDVAAAAPAPAAAEAAAPPQPATQPSADQTAGAQPAPAEAPPTTSAAVETVAALPAAVAVIAPPEEEEESFQAVPLRDRLVLPGKLGAVAGAAFGMLTIVLASPLLLDKVRLAGEEGAFDPVVAVEPAKMLLALAVISAVFGALIGRLAANVPSWFDRGLTVRSSARSVTIIGAATGAVLGVVAGGILISGGEAIEPVAEGDPSIVLLGVVPSMVVIGVGGALLGAAVAVAAQVLALPAGLSESEEEESDVIKHRLVTSYMMPVMVVVGIAALVLPFAYLLVQFASYAPILAIVAAGGILGFAGLSASRPGSRITAGEFFVAAAGIGTILLFIALVANAVGTGH